MPQNADQDLFYTVYMQECLFKIKKKYIRPPGLIQFIRLEESIRHIWVNFMKLIFTHVPLSSYQLLILHRVLRKPLRDHLNSGKKFCGYLAFSLIWIFSMFPDKTWNRHGDNDEVQPNPVTLCSRYVPHPALRACITVSSISICATPRDSVLLSIEKQTCICQGISLIEISNLTLYGKIQIFPNETVSLTSVRCVDVMYQCFLCLATFQNNLLADAFCQPFVFYRLKTLLCAM